MLRIAWVMFVPQGKSTNSCAEPREVVDVTFRAPGTARAASSNGSVTSTSICCAGMLPLSIFTRRRGNETIGKSSTGSVIQA
jgi:hypothetical protein